MTAVTLGLAGGAQLAGAPVAVVEVVRAAAAAHLRQGRGSRGRSPHRHLRTILAHRRHLHPHAETGLRLIRAGTLSCPLGPLHETPVPAKLSGDSAEKEGEERRMQAQGSWSTHSRHVTLKQSQRGGPRAGHCMQSGHT